MLGTITSYMDAYMAHKGKCVLGVNIVKHLSILKIHFKINMKW